MYRFTWRTTATATSLLLAALVTVAGGAVLTMELAQNAPPARRAPAAAPAAVPPAPPPAPAPAPPAAAAAESGQPAAPPPPIPTRTEILNFENWVVTCNEFAEGPQKRVCSALLQILQQKTNQMVFTWTVGLDNNKQMVTIIQTPTGVLIPPGVELKVGKVPPHKVPFASCDTGRCVATMPMDAPLLHEMTTVATAEAIIQGAQGNTVQFNIQMKGFDKAFAALSRP